MYNRDHTASNEVKDAASGQWPFVLQELAGLTDLQVDTRTRSTGTSCPICGGHDRYSFKDPENGWWACRHCGGGDGITLLMKSQNWDFVTTIKKVALLLGVDRYNPIELEKTRKEAKERRDRQRREQEEMEREQHAAAIGSVRRLWSEGKPCNYHPYAEYKLFSERLKGLCRVAGSNLLVPVCSADGWLMNVQRIEWQPRFAQWPKYFVKSAPVKGGFLAYGRNSYHILIAEGIADTDACYQLQNEACKVVCAFSAYQFTRIAQLARTRFPESEIILCPDNDDTGLKQASNAALQVPGCALSPPPKGYKDWSQFFVSQSNEVA